MTYDEKIKKLRTARNILSKLEDRGILENNLSAEQITALRIAEYALDELWKSKEGQPVKRGRWSECYTDSHHYSGICTVCGKASIRSIKENSLEYCPKCGARMDGDTE